MKGQVSARARARACSGCAVKDLCLQMCVCVRVRTCAHMCAMGGRERCSYECVVAGSVKNKEARRATNLV